MEKCTEFNENMIVTLAAAIACFDHDTSVMSTTIESMMLRLAQGSI